MQNKKAVAGYFSSKQLLPLGFAVQRCGDMQAGCASKPGALNRRGRSRAGPLYRLRARDIWHSRKAVTDYLKSKSYCLWLFTTVLWS